MADCRNNRNALVPEEKPDRIRLDCVSATSDASKSDLQRLRTEARMPSASITSALRTISMERICEFRSRSSASCIRCDDVRWLRIPIPTRTSPPNTAQRPNEKCSMNSTRKNNGTHGASNRAFIAGLDRNRLSCRKSRTGLSETCPESFKLAASAALAARSPKISSNLDGCFAKKA